MYHGFVRAANGTVTSFDAPGAGTKATQGTSPSSINTAGDITGTYSDTSSAAHGFVLTPALKTMTTLTSSPNPSNYGQAVTFTAVVTPAPPDGETVSFMEGKTVLGTGPLSGGSASFTTAALKVGTTTATAVYYGDSHFSSSTSKTVKQVVSKATTTIALSSSLNPSKVGQSVTFTATVDPQFSGTVKGTVTFYDGTTTLKAVSLSGGLVKCTTTKLTLGKHTITATYDGSTSFEGSTSAPLTQTVN